MCCLPLQFHPQDRRQETQTTAVFLFMDLELPTDELVNGEWHDIVAGENGAIINDPWMEARNAVLATEGCIEGVRGPGAMRLTRHYCEDLARNYFPPLYTYCHNSFVMK